MSRQLPLFPPDKPKREKATVKDAQDFVEKWVGLFGFAHYRWRVLPLRSKHRGRVWATVGWDHLEEWLEIQIVPDGVLPSAQVEHVVMHELAHVLIALAGQSDSAEESVVTRLVRLAGGPARGAREFVRRTGGTHAWDDDSESELVDLCPKTG